MLLSTIPNIVGKQINIFWSHNFIAWYKSKEEKDRNIKIGRKFSTNAFPHSSLVLFVMNAHLIHKTNERQFRIEIYFD